MPGSPHSPRYASAPPPACPASPVSAAGSCTARPSHSLPATASPPSCGAVPSPVQPHLFRCAPAARKLPAHTQSGCGSVRSGWSSAIPSAIPRHALGLRDSSISCYSSEPARFHTRLPTRRPNLVIEIPPFRLNEFYCCMRFLLYIFIAFGLLFEKSAINSLSHHLECFTFLYSRHE